MKRIMLILSLILSFDVRAANIEAMVDKKNVSVDEIFVLTLTADDNINERPNLEVLNQNFNVYSNSVSRSTYVVNGKVSNTTKWQIGLSANKVGEQTIPPIKVGNDVSNEIKIKVLKEDEISDDIKKQNEVRYAIKTQIDEYKSWYVQEQIPYNVIITDVGGLQGGEPVFDNNDDWIIKSLGQPDVESKYINGKAVREITFKYVLFAQKSGELKIPAVRFNGYKVSDNGGGIFMGNIFSLNVGMPSAFGFEVPISLTAPMRNITIKPVPKDYNGSWWLPAKSVELEADFVENTTLVEREAFSREIVLTAVGVIDTQLPEFNFINSKNLKQYPQKSSSENEVIDGEIVATKKIINVYIPETSGEVILPAIEIKWFDVINEKEQIAKIPEQQINVKKNLKLSKQIENNMVKRVDNVIPKHSEKFFNIGQLISVIVIVFLLGLGVGYYIFKCRKSNTAKPYCETRVFPDFIIKKAYENDFRSLRDAIISWAVGFYPEQNISTLKDVAKASGNEIFAKQIDVLIAKLYNPRDEQIWNAKEFADAYKKISKKIKRQEKKHTPLPNLYQ